MRGLRSPDVAAGLAITAIALAIGSGAGCAGGSGAMGGGHGGSSSAGGRGGSSTTSSAMIAGSGGGGSKACASDADCTGDPKGAVCDAASGACVGCSTTNDACPDGQYCDAASSACADGCKGDGDCAGNTNGAVRCGLSTHACVMCSSDDECPLGQLCATGGNVCIPGCSPSHACPDGETCCGSSCHDLTSDLDACGDCATSCPSPANAVSACEGGACAIKSCLAAFSDCNGDFEDGCEWNQLQDGPCVCAPGETKPCYQGEPSTFLVGPCHGGLRTCDPSGAAWGPCEGQVLPISEICNNGVDDDCDGTADNVPDIDGDGWTACDGDCCELAGPGCAKPKLVNPGAFEVVGDGVDNDCDPTTSDAAPPPLCSAAQKFTGVTAMDVAKAMDLCQTTPASPPLAQRKWGLVSATHLLANGATPSAAQLANMESWQSAVLLNFGAGGVGPKKGVTMAGLSSGKMRDETDAGYDATANHNPGTAFSTSYVTPPAAYTASHGGSLAPGSCGNTTCLTGTGAYDSVVVRLQIRVPTNALGFSYDFRFFSAEYQSYQCTPFNDYYLALLTSGAPGLPADHNISYDALGKPVSVNNGFFQVCPGNSKNCGPCPLGTGALAGTGMELIEPFSQKVTGGATAWLTTDAPVVGGETITLDLMIFDVQDPGLDSIVLLDNFRWSLTPVTVGTHT